MKTAFFTVILRSLCGTPPGLGREDGPGGVANQETGKPRRPAFPEWFSILLPEAVNQTERNHVNIALSVFALIANVLELLPFEARADVFREIVLRTQAVGEIG